MKGKKEARLNPAHRCRTALLLTGLLAFALWGEGEPQERFPYDKTEHGGRDVNGDGTSGVFRPPNEPPGIIIDPAKFRPGDCVHCHSQHASHEGQGYPPQERLLFKPSGISLCATCHDNPNAPTFYEPWFLGWAGWQRSQFYRSSKHGDPTGGVQWVAGASYAGLANQINAHLTTPAPPPGASRIYEKGHCLNCHNPHGYYPGDNADALATPQEQSEGVLNHMLVRTMGSQTGSEPAEANALCNYCHDNINLFGSGTDHDLASKSYWYKGSQGLPDKYTGFQATPHRSSSHRYNLFPGNAYYPPRTGEKGSCLNCHDPHGGAPGANLNGSPGGSAPSNRMLVEPMIDASQPSRRNGLCLRCHDPITTTSGAGVQKFLGGALYDETKHATSPKAYWGRKTDPYDGSPTAYDVTTAFWGPRSPSDHGLCLNCHNPHTFTIGTVTINGTNVIPNLLLDHYNNGLSKALNVDPNNFRLCLNCHSESRLMDQHRAQTGFREHKKNLHAEHLHEGMFCNDCHNPHGYDNSKIAGSPPPGKRNMAFSPNALPSEKTVTINGTPTNGPTWFYNARVDGKPNRYGCLLKCHGKDHNPEYYTPSPTPRLVQYNYRWFFDNTGSDNHLIAGANLNTPLTEAQRNGHYRLRVQVGEENNVAAVDIHFKLQYSYDGGRTWIDVGPAKGTGTHWRYADSPHVTDKGTVSALLLPPTMLSTDRPGSYVESAPTIPLTLQDSSYEFDFILEPLPGQVLPSTTYLFRLVVTDASGSEAIPLHSYERYPTLTTASGAKGYFAGTEGLRLFTDSTYTTEIYPQFSLIPAGATVYLEVITDSDGSLERSVWVKDHRQTPVAGPFTLTRDGAGPPYTYRVALPLPTTTDREYFLEVHIRGNFLFHSYGPLLTVGTTTPSYYLHTYADSDYQTLTEAYAPGDTVYVEVKSAVDGTPSGAESLWELIDFRGNSIASGHPETVQRVAPRTYRLTFFMPPLTDGHWYALRCTLKDEKGTVLAQGPLRLVKVSRARETRLQILVQGEIESVKIRAVKAIPSLVAPGQPVKVSVIIDPDASFPGRLFLSLDTLPDAPQRHPSSFSSRLIPLRSDPKGRRFETLLPSSDWRVGSSHALYLGTTDKRGQFVPLAGTVVGVFPKLSSRAREGMFIWVSYFLDETCTLPVPTPNGTPAVEKPQRLYIRVQVMDGEVTFPLRLFVDAPGTLNDVEGIPMQRVAPFVFLYAWDLRGGPGAKGRAQVKLVQSDGTEIVPLIGASLLLFEREPRPCYLQMTVAPPILEADGKSIATVTVKVTDANGTPLPHRPVDFRRLSGGGTLVPIAPVTDERGEAKARYVAGVTAETAVIEAIEGLTGQRIQGFVRLKLTGVTSITLDPTLSRKKSHDGKNFSLTLKAYPSRLPPDGISTSTIVAFVRDGEGRPRPGVRLLFRLLGEGRPFGRLLVTRPITDRQGRAEALYFAGTTPGEVAIVVTEPIMKVSKTITIILTGNGAARVTVKALPATLPADGKGISQIIVRVTDLQGRPVIGAEVSLTLRYGLGQLFVPTDRTDGAGEVIAFFHAGSMPGREVITATVLSAIPEGMDIDAKTEGDEGPSLTRQSYQAPSLLGTPLKPHSQSPPLFPNQRGFPEDILITLGDILSHFSFTYGIWEQQAKVKFRTGPLLSLRLRSESLGIRTRRPFFIGGRAISLRVAFDRHRSLSYGFLTTYEDTDLSVRITGRHFSLSWGTNFLKTVTKDLRQDALIKSEGTASLFSLTLNFPRLPTLSWIYNKGVMNIGVREARPWWRYELSSVSVSYQLGPLTWRLWESRRSSGQRWGGSIFREESRFRTISVGFQGEIFSRLSFNASLDLVRTGTKGAERERATGELHASLDLRYRPSRVLSLTATRAWDDVTDTALRGQKLSFRMTSLSLLLHPLPVLSLQVGMRDEREKVGLVGTSQRTVKTFNLSLQPALWSTITYSLNRTDERAPTLSGGSLLADNRALQCLFRISQRVRVGMEWSRLHLLSPLGETKTRTESTFADLKLSKALLARLTLSDSNVSGMTEGLPFAYGTKTADLTLFWRPSRRVTLTYSLSRLLQEGREAASGSERHSIRLSVLMDERLSLLADLTQSRLRQAVSSPEGRLWGWFQGERSLVRIYYRLDERSTLFVEWERLQDELGEFAGSTSIRWGYSTRF